MYNTMDSKKYMTDELMNSQSTSRYRNPVQNYSSSLYQPTIDPLAYKVRPRCNLTINYLTGASK